MKKDVKKLELIADSRGWLTEVLKSGSETGIEQVHFSVTKPGAVRGKHYHKNRIEWMFVTNGTGKVTLEDNVTKEISELDVTGDCPVLIKICPNVTHTILNNGNLPMHLLVLTSAKHEQPDSDTFYG
jgi:UDP-2-acetamido-2,6-beta-L-arabino-hexul-4-ose reductase